MDRRRTISIAVLHGAVSGVVSSEANDELIMVDNVVRECADATLQHHLFTMIDSGVSSRVTIQDFVEDIVSAYSDLEFKRHFRMSRSCYEELVTEVRQHIAIRRSSHYPVENKVLLTLWALGNQESFRQIGDRFDLDRGVAHVYYAQVCRALRRMKDKFIRWPSTEEMSDVAKDFYFPLTVGAIDGCHVPIKAPLHELESYTNRKSHTSVLLQAVCDGKMKFTDVSVGWAGSMHDARVFRLSHLGKKLEESGLHPYHILGDSAYPLKNYLVVPFRDNGHLTAPEKKFNTLHSGSRCIVERSFARLKGKFRRLKYLDMDNKTLLSDVIVAACVLHNFILSRDYVDDSHGVPSIGSITAPHSSLTPAARRDELMHMLT